MTRQTFEFRVPVKKLVIAVAVTVLPIAILGLYISTKSSEAAREILGSQSVTIAHSIGQEVSEFIRGHVAEARLIAADSAVINLVRESNASYGNRDAQAAQSRIDRIESIWNKPEGESVVNQVLLNNASLALRRMLSVDPRFLRITVTDERGATVAATHKTMDYFQADEEYWQNIYAQGRGAISITDVLYDEASKAHYVGIGVPVVDNNFTFLGTLDALVDVSSLFPIIQRARPTPGAAVQLTKADGTIIAASEQNVSLSSPSKSEVYAAVVDAAPNPDARQSGYIVRDLSRGNSLIGFARTDLARDFTKLDWTVTVTQPTAAALAPIRSLDTFLTVLMTLILLGLVLSYLYFSVYQRKEEYEEPEFHPGHETEPTVAR